MSILFLVSDMLQSFIVLQCYESLFESMRNQMGAGSAPTQQKNLASGKNQECSVPWQFAKHSGISQMILADCLWSDVEALSVRCSG